MRRLLCIAFLICLLVPAVFSGQRREKLEAAVGAESSWVLSVGGGVGSDSGVVSADGGWYVGLETPALASSWTVALTYQDLGTQYAQVGARRYMGTKSTWFWFGFGLGAAKLDLDVTDYAPGGFVEAGMSWELTPHISWELAGDVGGWHATEFRSFRGRVFFDPVDTWEIVPKARTGVGFVF